MKIISIFTLITYVTILSPKLYADEAASMPVELKIGNVAPFTGILMSLELAKKSMRDSEIALKVPLLEQLNLTNQSIIDQQTKQIGLLQDDKKTQSDTINKMTQDYNNANKYNSWIFAGFFAGGVLFALGMVLVTGFVIQKASPKASAINIQPLVKF